MSEPLKPSLSVEDAVAQGLACRCGGDTEGHEASDHLSHAGVNAAADIFMSYLPDNNRATSDSDRHAARQIIIAYLQGRET